MYLGEQYADDCTSSRSFEIETGEVLSQGDIVSINASGKVERISDLTTVDQVALGVVTLLPTEAEFNNALARGVVNVALNGTHVIAGSSANIGNIADIKNLTPITGLTGVINRKTGATTTGVAVRVG